MNLTAIVDNSRKTRQRYGATATTRFLTMAALRRFMAFERVHVFAMTQAAEIHRRAGRRTRLATVEDVTGMATDPIWELEQLDVAAVEHLFAAGHRCVLNAVDGEIAGYGWMNPNHLVIPKLRASLALSPGEVHIYNDFTHPAHRGQRLGVDRYVHWLGEIGQGRTLVTDFAFDNDATMTRVRHLGLEPLGVGTYLAWGDHESRRFSPSLASREMSPIPEDLPHGAFEP